MNNLLDMSIIDTTDFSQFDALEFTGVVEGECGDCTPVTDDSEPDFYSIYGHYDTTKGGAVGVDCIADFKPTVSRETALQNAEQLAKKVSLQLNVFG